MAVTLLILSTTYRKKLDDVEVDNIVYPLKKANMCFYFEFPI